jgi:hypothetical protein
MGFPNSKFVRSRMGRLVAVASTLMMYGCGDGGSGPGVAPPPANARATPVDIKDNPPTETGKSGPTPARGVAPVGAQ